MSHGFDLSCASGPVQPKLLAEFPGLRLRWTALDARVRRSPRAVAERLAQLSDRYRGTGVVAMRTQPIPHAYRVFFRQAGVDPDAARIPSEEAAVARLLQGHFRSRDVLHDARLIALVETGVPVWALDARVVDVATLGVRTAVAGDRLGRARDGARPPPGGMVVADRGVVHAMLFADPAPGHAPGRRTRRVVLFAVAVDGIPGIHVEEALLLCADILGAE